MRTLGLYSQVLRSDEVHAFRAALRMSLPEALVSYPATANSPPFNAWLRLLIDMGLQPSELALRIPVWLTGMALLLVVPLWVGRRLGTRVGVVLAWLLAISPILAFYSRFMRPYSPYVLLTVVAAGLLFDWAQRPRRATGLVFAIVAAMAIYMHLLAVPVIVAFFAWLLIEHLIRRRASLATVPSSAIVGLGAVTAALMALFIVPAWPNLVTLAASRRVAVEATGSGVIDAMEILVGSQATRVCVVVWLLAAAGAVSLARRAPSLARLVVLVVIAQAIGVPLLSPSFIGSPPILARYMLPILVPTLLLVAVAVEPRGSAWRRRFTSAGAVALVVVLFATGPLASRHLYTNSLAWGRETLNVHRPAPLPVRPAPRPYELLSRVGGSVVEVPLRAASRFTEVLADYQRGHGLPVRISPGDSFLSDPRYELDTIVDDEPGAFRASGARWVVLHKRWMDELGPSLGFTGEPSAAQMRGARNLLDLLERQARKDYRALHDAWGPPGIETELLAIWDLERVR